MPVPHLPVPTVLLSVVYAAAIAVALAHPGEHTLAGLVVLAGLVARWAVRHRHALVTAQVAVPAPAEPAAPAAAPATAA
ncbi:hypothetical protein DQ239_18460 [Blastococcus sp. TF02-09]|nr:hypothetical protein DQ239_18460 [Blastococcus sp. TF02-9]